MPDPISRRAFAEQLALAAAAPLVAIDALDAPLPRLVPALPSPVQQQAEPSPLARALAEGIRVRYGDRLGTDDMKTIAQGIEARLQGMERLYRVALANSDEPDFVFSVYRGE